MTFALPEQIAAIKELYKTRNPSAWESDLAFQFKNHIAPWARIQKLEALTEVQAAAILDALMKKDVHKIFVKVPKKRKSPGSRRHE